MLQKYSACHDPATYWASKILKHHQPPKWPNPWPCCAKCIVRTLFKPTTFANVSTIHTNPCVRHQNTVKKPPTVLPKPAVLTCFNAFGFRIALSPQRVHSLPRWTSKKCHQFWPNLWPLILCTRSSELPIFDPAGAPNYGKIEHFGQYLPAKADSCLTSGANISGCIYHCLQLSA